MSSDSQGSAYTRCSAKVHSYPDGVQSRKPATDESADSTEAWIRVRTASVLPNHPCPKSVDSLTTGRLVPWHLLAVITLATLLRIAVAIYLGDVANPVSGANDQYSYDALAQRVAGGYGFSFPTAWYPFTAADEPTAHWSYLYTLYLAAVYLLVGHHPLVARIIQTLLSAIGIWLTYRIGARLFGERAGLAAAALAAGYAYLIFFAAALMTQTFYIIALLAAINTALDLAERPSWRGWLLLGLALGIGALMRQTLLLFAPLLLAWLWLKRPRTEGRGRSPVLGHPSSVIGLLLTLTVIALFILPFTVYNYVTFHDFLLLNSNGGYWMYSSNHPNQGTHFDGTYAAPLPDNLRGLPEPALDRALYRQGIRFILDDPKRFLLLSLSRLDDYFWILPSANSSLASNLGRMLSYPLYLPFMLFGLYLSRHNWRQCLPIYLYILFEGALCIFTWAGPRYRLPSDALLMVFAGLAVMTAVHRLQARITWSARIRPRSSQA